MASRDRISKLKQYISEDRPQRLRTYVRKHRMTLSDLRLKKGRNLLHYCCKHGSAAIFKYLLQEGVSGCHSDDRMDSPLHTALYRAIQLEEAGSQHEATECYTGLVLPLIEGYPDLLSAKNRSGMSCRTLLQRLVQHRGVHAGHHQVTAKIGLTQGVTVFALAPPSYPSNQDKRSGKTRGSPSANTPSNYGDPEEREWKDKLTAEWQDEYHSMWGQYEQGFTDMYTEKETYDDWADRINQEYRAKKGARATYESKGDATRGRKRKSDKTTGPQSGPDNLEDIRAKMREQFDQRKKENNVIKVLKQRMKYEKRYKELVEKTDIVELDFNDVPWPSVKGSEYDLGVLFDGMDVKSVDYKKYLRDQQIRWHPDKFMQRFGKRLKQTSREQILQRVTALSQSLNKLKS